MSSFNDYLETFKGMAVEGAQTAVKKTKQLAAIAKANLAIRSEEEKIKKAQIELGKLYYKDYIVGEEPDPAEYNPWCEKISESKIAIEDLRIAIEDIRNSDDDSDDDDFVVEVTEEDLVSEPAEEKTAAEEADIASSEDNGKTE